jgi:hypothetical protein
MSERWKMDEEKIDLSELDPSRDAPRWARMVESVAARAMAARRARPSSEIFAEALVRRARPMLAFAAAAAILVWAGAWNAGRHRTSTTAASAVPALALAQWAAEDSVPSTSNILDVLGGTQ